MKCTPFSCGQEGDISASSTRNQCNVSAAKDSCDDSLSERQNVVIVDNIQDLSRFGGSQQILKEVNNFAPTIQVKHAYSLARGGVAIHVKDQCDKQALLTELSKGAFGGADTYDLSSKSNVVIVKEVPLCVSADAVKHELEIVFTGIYDVERLLHKKSGRPLLVVKVKCSSAAAK